MSYDRRHFLKTTGMLATGVALGVESLGETLAGTARPFGLQLYSLRDDLPKDPKGVLKQVAGFGYKQIESYEGSQGMFWGMGAVGFKKFVDSLGMTVISSHTDINKNFEKKAAEAAGIGMKYLICPYIGAQKSIEAYKKIAEQFNQCGAICKKNGIRFAYHNHGYTFTKFEGVMPQDILMQNTDPSLVDFQMDIYWVVTPGEDPVKWLKKYPNRFKLGHVKDRLKTATPKDQDASCDLGTGSIDFSTILKVAQKQGMKYYIVEQEEYEGSTPLKSAAVDAAYMKKLKI